MPAVAGALDGKTVLVLGVSGGVGLGAARALLTRGARVVGVGRDEGRLAETREDLTPLGRIDVLPADLSSDSVADTARRLRDAYGAFDGALISLGDPGDRPTPVLDTPLAELARMTRTNVETGLRALQTVVPLVQPRGAVVNLLGFSSEIPFPHNPLMAATNAALRSLVVTLAEERRRRGPRVYGLVLGVVRTAARQRVGIDDPSWLSGDQVGDVTADLIASPDSTLPALLYLLDPVQGLTERSPQHAP